MISAFPAVNRAVTELRTRGRWSKEQAQDAILSTTALLASHRRLVPATPVGLDVLRAMEAAGLAIDSRRGFVPTGAAMQIANRSPEAVRRALGVAMADVRPGLTRGRKKPAPSKQPTKKHFSADERDFGVIDRDARDIRNRVKSLRARDKNVRKS